MREIKFRVWSRYYKEFWYVDFGQEFELKKEPENILMQFTGLHDKNGKEIWEGDVVYIRECNGKHKVKWFVDYGGMTLGIECSSNVRSEFWEVIGNIYENPELLKGGGPPD